MERFETKHLPDAGPEALPGPRDAPLPDAAGARRCARQTEDSRIRRRIAPPIQEVRVRPEPTPLVTYIYDYLRSFYNVLLMASFVPFLVYFLLSWRDHLRSRFLYHVRRRDRATPSHNAWDGVGDMVRAYVIGNFLLGLLLSVASAILFASVKLPYWLVVAPISGFLSLVPYIGLPLAMIPPLIAALPATREPACTCSWPVSVGLLHLFALNLLYPKFVGSRVHLNPLVVTVALMFWGMLWGGIGLLLAIPLTAAIKAVCDNVSSLQRLRPTDGRLIHVTKQFWMFLVIGSRGSRLRDRHYLLVRPKARTSNSTAAFFTSACCR